jgi:hypothetical protein
MFHEHHLRGTKPLLQGGHVCILYHDSYTHMSNGHYPGMAWYGHQRNQNTMENVLK